MPRFHFELTNGHRLPDPTGLDCPNEQDAKGAADLIAQQIAHDLDGASSRCVIVVDEDGKQIYQVPIQR
jgi:hypothetical protein